MRAAWYNDSVQLRRHAPGLALVFLALGVVCLGDRSDTPSLRHLAHLLSEPFNVAFLTLGILALLYRHWRERSLPCLRETASVMLGVTAAIHLTKFATGKLWGLFPRPSGGWGGFPSGHTAAACALAFLLSERYPRWAPLWYGAAAAIAWSRLEAGAHFGYQIVAGALLGLAVAIGGRSRRLPLSAVSPRERAADAGTLGR